MTTGRERPWTYRRRAVFLTLAAAFGGLGYLMGWGDDTALHREIAGGLTNVLWLVLGAYVGGATADDWLRDREGR